MSTIAFAIATTTISPFGSLMVFADHRRTKLGDWVRRSTRTATLDGSSVVVDSGFSHTDRTIVIDLTGQDKDVIDDFKAICESFSSVAIFLPDGAYMACPERVVDSPDNVTASFLISGPAVWK